MSKNKNIDSLDPYVDAGDGLPLFSGEESRDGQAKKMGRFVEEFKAKNLDDIPIDLVKGGFCPTCTQFAKLYKRSINRGMVKILFWLSYNTREGEWVHTPSRGNRQVLRSNEISKLELWGFVESRENENDGKKYSGVWRLKEKGRTFLLGKMRVPKYFTIYNNEVYESSEEDVCLEDCRDVDFDYRTLMES